MLNVKLKSW